MSTRMSRGATLLLTVLLAAGPIGLEAQDRRPIDHEVYEIWRTIGSRAISADGAWVTYTLDREIHDGELVVHHVDSGREHRIDRGASPAFSADGRFVAFHIRPHVEESRQARREGRPSAEQPRDSLGILELESGTVTRVSRLRNFQLASESGGWLAYHLHPAPAEGEDAAPRNGPVVLRSLVTGAEQRVPHATAYALADDGSVLVVAVDRPEDEGGAGVVAVWPEAAPVTWVMEAPGSYRSLSLSDDAGHLAFLHAAPTDDDAPPAEHVLYHWAVDDSEARAVARSGTAGIPEGWWVSEHGSVSFSDDGGRLFFGTAPRPEPEPEPEVEPLREEVVTVDVWHWNEPTLMSVQRIREDQERRRSYQAVLHLADDRVVQLADGDLPSVSVPQGGTAARGVGTNSTPYGVMSDWESPNFSDTYLVDVSTGERERVRTRGRGGASLSPEGRYLTWYEPGDSIWYARHVATGEVRDISSAIPTPVYNERHDSPSPAGSYGSAGWLEDDAAILIYDRHDLWAVDPSGSAAPRNLTRGEGATNGIRFRLLSLGRDEPAWGPNQEVWLSAFHEWTKEAGFYRTTLAGDRSPERLVFEDRSFSNPVKADAADRVLFTQETFEEFPDLWVAGLDFAGRSRVSEANPQQDEYRWGTAELVDWMSNDGNRLQGVLLKPENFDPARQYPMVVYFYERWSDGLHNHYALVPHRSRIAFPMYTSNDYLVFIPDIVYRIGYPGESALNAVNPGVLHLVDQGFVDPDRVGLQGHSWGGYQIAFMVTRTGTLYRAGAAGAPVANMTSAYGGIRRETGLVRQFQYERTQSRIGGSLWEYPIRYYENSPLFFADKIETPLLIMHNDRDGHVPWEQGIELFAAMRRLGTPAWLINYNDEPHWPTTFANRVDWNIRLQQFFDHFLKDAPPPRWMFEGIPAVERGTTLGYELMEGASAVDPDRR